jgi:hypothetical protein
MAGNSRMNARRFALLWAVLATLATLGLSSASAVALQSGTPPTKAPPPNAPPELWEPGDEVVPPKPLPGGRGTGKAGDKGTGSGKDAAAPSGTSGTSADDGGPAWSVLLGTFTGDDHAAAADAAKARLVARFPQVSDCFVRRVSRGSVLLVGRYSGPSDPAAQAKLKELKAIVVDGQRPFTGVMLTRTTTDAGPPGPHDLRRLRERHPQVKPLYTLQVAVWSTFGDAKVSRTEMRQSAEKFCKELRLKNIEAWVHHDDDTGTSSVLVGAFDSSAYDSKSTLFAPEVEQLMKRFPRHLVNGEEVLVPVDPRRPEGAKRPQGCRLVEVPLF